MRYTILDLKQVNSIEVVASANWVKVGFDLKDSLFELSPEVGNALG